MRFGLPSAARLPTLSRMHAMLRRLLAACVSASAAVPLTALSAPSPDGDEMARFDKSFPAMEARVRQRKFNLDRGLAMGDDAPDAEGLSPPLTPPDSGFIVRADQSYPSKHVLSLLFPSLRLPSYVFTSPCFASLHSASCVIPSLRFMSHPHSASRRLDSA